ncbi:MAG: hypothetical protein HY521_08035 [Proteobacteria bacterium]|nr:hypothetical protein [Pseudomonadota bacterium]
MFKTRIAGLLAATALGTSLVLGGSETAQAVTAQATLGLQGSVAIVVTITVTPSGTPTNLDLTTEQTVTKLEVADPVTTKSNNPAGYTVKVSSANLVAGSRCATATSPCLWNAAAEEALTFDVHKDAGSALTFASGEASWLTKGTIDLGGTVSTAEITYTISGVLPSGTYTETLTFTITSS